MANKKIDLDEKFKNKLFELEKKYEKLGLNKTLAEYDIPPYATKENSPGASNEEIMQYNRELDEDFNKSKDLLNKYNSEKKLIMEDAYIDFENYKEQHGAYPEGSEWINETKDKDYYSKYSDAEKKRKRNKNIKSNTKK